MFFSTVWACLIGDGGLLPDDPCSSQTMPQPRTMAGMGLDGVKQNWNLVQDLDLR